MLFHRKTGATPSGGLVRRVVGHWRSVLVLGLSVVVLSALAGYAALTPTTKVFASTSVTWTSSPDVVLYGWVHGTTGAPIHNAVIEVVKFGPGGKKTVFASQHSAVNGTYRMNMRLPKTEYWVLIHLAPSGAGWNTIAAVHHILAPGMHLKADAKVVQTTHFWILPISIY